MTSKFQHCPESFDTLDFLWWRFSQGCDTESALIVLMDRGDKTEPKINYFPKHITGLACLSEPACSNWKQEIINQYTNKTTEFSKQSCWKAKRNEKETHTEACCGILITVRHTQVVEMDRCRKQMSGWTERMKVHGNPQWESTPEVSRVSLIFFLSFTGVGKRQDCLF